MAKPNLRHLCLQALEQWEETSAYAENIVSDLTKQHSLSPADRGFLNTVTLGIVRNLFLLDHWIDSMRQGKLSPDNRRILRIGLYQILMMRVPDHAAVNETVSLSRSAARGLINAVLRRSIREREQLLADIPNLEPEDRYSLPDFLFERWCGTYGRELTEAICQSNNEPAPIYVRENTLRPGPLGDTTPVPGQPGFYFVENLTTDALDAGHAYVQDPATALAPRLLNPQPGDTVLDACAAPGGKTALLAQMMGNQGKIYATDSSKNRCERLSENLDRLGVTNTEVLQCDWSTNDNALIQSGIKFERILLDVPCSNTGVIRRRVDVKWRLEENFTPTFQKAQIALVESCLPCLAPGGSLVYSTCSIEPDENQNVIAKLLAAHPNLELKEEQQWIPARDGFDGAYCALLVDKGAS